MSGILNDDERCEVEAEMIEEWLRYEAPELFEETQVAFVNEDGTLETAQVPIRLVELFPGELDRPMRARLRTDSGVFDLFADDALGGYFVRKVAS